MEKLPTAREILAKHAKNYEKTVERDEKTLYHLSLNGFEAINAMVEFGKLCAAAALKAAAERAECYDDYKNNLTGDRIVDKSSILTAYPPENIK